MTDSPGNAAQRVAEARQRGDADDLAEALALDANDLITRGRIADARRELDEAAELHHRRGRAYDEARCTQFAATLCRFQGHFDEARARCRRALALVDGKGPIAVSAFAELGEIALAEHKPLDAAQAYQSSLDAGDATGLVDPARAALLRKRAAALTAAGRFDDAIRDLESAHDLLVRSGDRAGALRTQIEQATAFQHAGRFNEAERVVEQAIDPARRSGDHAALADLELLLATNALNRGDATAAMAAARAARTEALAANAATSYIAAAVAISRLAEAAGDRVSAYDALATGWATLSDLLGRDLARTTFEPPLRALRERWGSAAFDAVKADYEAKRRKTIAERSTEA